MQCRFEERMQRGETTIINATHSKSNDFAKYKDLIERYRYRAYGIDFRDVPIERAKAQNKMREHYKIVPEHVIDTMYARFTHQSIPSYINLIKDYQVEDIITYKPLDWNEYNNIYVIGDIHSSYEPLKEFFDKNPFDERSKYIFLGDFFDRNDQTKEILDFLVKMHNRPNIQLIRGNHEEHLIKYAYDESDINIKAKEFKYHTLPQIKEQGADFGLLRNICRRFTTFAYFTFCNKRTSGDSVNALVEE